MPLKRAEHFTVGITVIARALRKAASATIFIVGLWACQEGSSLGIRASKLDKSRYFPDPKVAAFVADIQDGNLKRVTEALKAGMSPNVAGNEGIRPMFFIFPASTADVTRALLAAGADPNVRLSNGNTPRITVIARALRKAAAVTRMRRPYLRASRIRLKITRFAEMGSPRSRGRRADLEGQ